MTTHTKLIIVKTIHTAIWLFFNVVIFYLAYAVISNKIDKWVWICLGFILLEGVVLLIFKNVCPVTLIARKYSTSITNNFDIFLPDWLAKYNKLIYTIVMIIICIVLAYRLFINGNILRDSAATASMQGSHGLQTHDSTGKKNNK